jgi:hypothetical protein
MIECDAGGVLGGEGVIECDAQEVLGGEEELK